MDIHKIVEDLRKERDRLNDAIEALLGFGTAGSGRRGRKTGTTIKSMGPKRRGGISAAGRKRLSYLMKKRWAERRKRGAKMHRRRTNGWPT